MAENYISTHTGLEVDTAVDDVSNKADISYVDNEDEKKADKTYVDSELAKKDDIVDVDAKLLEKANINKNMRSYFDPETRVLYTSDDNSDPTP